MLCGEFWHEGELCILFADTNLGKSILAVQIANLISKGQSDNVFKVEAVKQKVLYFDFELSPKQFEKRYSENYKNHYVWDSNLFRIEINPDCTAVIDFEGTLYSEIAKAVIEQEAKILIVDNITYLKGQSTDTAKEALPLMNMLNGLKKKYGLSILVLAHTPKINQSLPITVNHLAGSKQLSNFADSIFAIGLSNRGAQMRYIKQIKARATEKIYDSDNVIVCEIDKPGNFLGFNFIAFDNERTHLKEVSDTEQAETDSQIIELYKENTSLSARDIAKQLGTNHTRVLRLLKKNGLKG
jgi:RecA-family ATPase